MTYNLSARAIERMREQLALLLPGKEIRFVTDEPHKLSYRLREAIAAAKHLSQEPFTNLDYQITQGNGFVLCKPRAHSLVKAHEIVAPSFPEAINEYHVVSAAVKSPHTELHFPNFAGNLSSVQRWAKEHGYDITQEPHLVITKTLRSS